MEKAKLRARQTWGKGSLHTREICIADVLGTCWGIHCWTQILQCSPELLGKTEQIVLGQESGLKTQTGDPLVGSCYFLCTIFQLSCSLFQSRLFLSIWNCCYLASKNLLEQKYQLPTSLCCCVLLSFATRPNRHTPPFPWLHSCLQTFSLSASMVKFCSDGAILAN